MRLQEFRGQLSNVNPLKQGLAEAGHAERYEGIIPYKLIGLQKRPGYQSLNRYGMPFRELPDFIDDGNFEEGYASSNWSITYLNGATGPSWPYDPTTVEYHVSDYRGTNTDYNHSMKIHHDAASSGSVRLTRTFSEIPKHRNMWLRVWVHPTSMPDTFSLTLKTTGLTSNVTRTFTKTQMEDCQDSDGWCHLELRRAAISTIGTESGTAQIEITNGGDLLVPATVYVDDFSFACETAVTGIFQFTAQAVLDWAAMQVDPLDANSPSATYLPINNSFNQTSGWSAEPESGSDEGSFAYTNEQLYVGSQSGLISHTTGTAGYSTYQRIQLQEGNKYYFVAQVWVPGEGVETETFFGSGLDDMSTGGTNTNTSDLMYVVQIDSTGTPDTIRWSDNGGQTWDNTGVDIESGAMTLNNGVQVTFGSTTSHTLYDKWVFRAFNSNRKTPDSAAMSLTGWKTGLPSPASVDVTRVGKWQQVYMDFTPSYNGWGDIRFKVIKDVGESRGDIYVGKIGVSTVPTYTVRAIRSLSSDFTLDTSGDHATRGAIVRTPTNSMMYRIAKLSSGNGLLAARELDASDAIEWVRVDEESDKEIYDLASTGGESLAYVKNDGLYYSDSAGKEGAVFYEVPDINAGGPDIYHGFRAMESFGGDIYLSCAYTDTVEHKDYPCLIAWNKDVEEWRVVNIFNDPLTWWESEGSGYGVDPEMFDVGNNIAWICLGQTNDTVDGNPVAKPDIWYYNGNSPGDGWQRVDNTLGSSIPSLYGGSVKSIAASGKNCYVNFRPGTDQAGNEYRLYNIDTGWKAISEWDQVLDYGYLSNSGNTGNRYITEDGDTYIIDDDGNRIDLPNINDGRVIDDDGGNDDDDDDNPPVDGDNGGNDDPNTGDDGGDEDLVFSDDGGTYRIKVDPQAPLPVASARWGATTLVTTADGNVYAADGWNPPRFAPLEDAPNECRIIKRGFSSQQWPWGTSFNGWFYLMNGINAAIRTDGVRAIPCGLAIPPSPPVISAGSAGDITGTYVVVYTYWDNDLQVETEPSPLSNYLTVTDKKIDMTDIRIPSARYNQINIYRPTNLEENGSEAVLYFETSLELPATSVTLELTDDELLKNRTLDTTPRSIFPAMLDAVAHENQIFLGVATDYRKGFAEFSAGSNLVEGTNTDWNSGMRGAYIIGGGHTGVRYQVSTVVDKEHLYLTREYTGTGFKGNYVITFEPSNVYRSAIDLESGAPLPENINFEVPIRVLPNDGDQLIGLSKDEGYVYAHKRRSICRLVKRQDGSYEVRPTNATCGGLRRTIRRDRRGYTLFFSPENPGIWLFDGQTTQELTIGVKDWFDGLDPSYFDDAHAIYMATHSKYLLCLSKDARSDVLVMYDDSIIDDRNAGAFGVYHQLKNYVSGDPTPITCSTVLNDYQKKHRAVFGDSAGRIYQGLVGVGDSSFAQTCNPPGDYYEHRFRWKSLPIRVPETEHYALPTTGMYQLHVIGSASSGDLRVLVYRDMEDTYSEERYVDLSSDVYAVFDVKTKGRFLQLELIHDEPEATFNVLEMGVALATLPKRGGK